jgi:hypothetical protein
MRRWIGAGCGLLALALLVPAQDKTAPATAEEGFKPLFNGKDLTGWVRVNNAPGTFYVKDNEIITTGVPTGYLRTDRMYENFILDFEWKHVPPTPTAVGNSGLFVWADPLPALGTGYSRAIEVQVLVNLTYKDKKTGKVTASSHGDLFSIHGATCEPDRPHPLGWKRCIPSEDRAKGAGEWNHYQVKANNGRIELAVNGKVVSGVSKCSPRAGYLALEAEGSECHFRNLKIKELPSTDLKPEEICDQGKDFVTLFTGIDLAGWAASDDTKAHWKALPGPNVLHYDGKGDAKESLATEKKYGDFELTCDCRLPKDSTAELHFRSGGKVDLSRATPGKWNRFLVTVKGEKMTVKVNGKVVENGELRGAAAGEVRLAPTGPADFASIFIRELK